MNEKKIIKRLENGLGIQIELVDLLEKVDWSEIYRVDTKKKERFYVKGSPRSRNEAQITNYLSRQYPDLVPRVVDIFTIESWQWFVISDAGETYDEIQLEQAKTVAYKLGQFQKKASKDTVLPEKLPLNTLESFDEIINKAIQWVHREGSIVNGKSTDITRSNFLDEIKSKLSNVPYTCVHGDFWGGNIAFNNQNIKVIDWADTMWGVGGVSILNLIYSNEFFNNQEEIWDLYSQGWGINIPDSYKEGCEVALEISSLKNDMQIAESCNKGIEMLPGLLPTLNSLIEQMK